jgi:phosphoglycerol transferase MdoB-like AlkP superfamily enzyme
MPSDQGRKAGAATFRYHLLLSLWLFFVINTMGGHPAYFKDFARVFGYFFHFLINWAIYFSFSYLVSQLLRRRAWHAPLLTGVAFLWAVVDRAKVDELGTHLSMMDLVLVKEAPLFFSYITLERVLHIATFLLLASVAFVWLQRKRLLHGKVLRWHLPSFAVNLLGLGLGSVFLVNGMIEVPGLIMRFRPHAMIDTYQRNGYVVAAIQHLYNHRYFLDLYELKPAWREKEKGDAERASSFNQSPRACKLKQDPDIVAVMVESMFDPTLIPGIHFSEDPLAALRDLEYPTSRTSLLVPVYGNGTANTEFEFLTGATHRFFPPGSVQYQSHIHSQGESLARLLAYRGYGSHAVHNYRRSFWRRNEVYPYLGFDSFAGLEDLGSGFESYPNGFPKDDVLADYVPRLMREDARQDASFYFIVTVGMHGAYGSSFWKGNDEISIRTDAMEAATKRQMRIYTSLLRDSSLALKKLVDRVMHRGRPTVVVLFGDHLPGIQKMAYQQSGYMSWVTQTYGITQQQEKVVPLLVLNNFKCNMELPPLLGSNCLATALTDRLFSTKELPTYWQFNRDFCQKHPYILEANPLELQGDFADYAAFIHQSVFNWKTLFQPPKGL